MFDDPRNSTGHLGSDCGIRFAAQMFVVAVLGDRALERVSKAVGRTAQWQPGLPSRGCGAVGHSRILTALFGHGKYRIGWSPSPSRKT